jgi:L-lactate dehydrogenase complex protein LldE
MTDFSPPPPEPPTSPHVGLFVTCLVDLVRPSVGFATIKLLEDAGCRVSVPENQTCCGQPAYNTGDNPDTAKIAHQVIAAFEKFDYVVVPSGSCGGMIKHHYPEVLAEDENWAPRAKALAAKTFELTSFLDNVLKDLKIAAAWETAATYHDSCSGLREMGVKEQPRNLLSKVNGLTLEEGEQAEACCGFGGLFCVKYPEISENMVDVKVDDIVATNAKVLLGGDLGCLLNISGRLSRRNIDVEVRHVAEVLADMTDGPAIGAPDQADS